VSIFVFGSNLAGRHGAGAAKYAKENHGAKYGIGLGRVGNSYAIPTKPYKLDESLPLYIIAGFIRQFIEYSLDNLDLQFDVTDIGCGLAGYKPEQIAPLFQCYKSNVRFVGKLNEALRCI
jgi:hypothetical protein